MFIHHFIVKITVNKAIIIGIAIAIIAVGVGAYSISSENNSIEPIPISDNNDENQPKKYVVSLSETVDVTIP